MKGKFCILIIATLMLTCIATIINSDIDVEATSGGGGEANNFFKKYYDYLWFKITDNLSYVVHNDSIWGEGDNVIRKGRAFGTAGDRWTANYIRDELQINLGLDNVQQLPLGPISNFPNRYYSNRINITDYRLHIDSENYSIDTGFPNDIPFNESFVVPICRRQNLLGSLTLNFTFEDEDNIRIRPTHDKWPPLFFSQTSNHYNMSCSAVNYYDIIMGNASYIKSNETMPIEQDWMVFMIDEEEDCDEKLDNVTNANGIILLYNNSTQYMIDNTTNYTFPMVRANSNDSNLSQILSIIDNETVWVDNIICNETLTFTYDMDNDSGWPDYNFVCLARSWQPNDEYEGETTWGDWEKRTVRLKWISIRRNNKCKGVILYDVYNDTHYMNNYNTPLLNGGWLRMFLKPGAPALPIFTVNNSVGSWLENHSDESDNTITGYVNQTYFKEDHENMTAGTIAYNVEGEINIENSPDDARVCISNRYDGWWSEAPFDSGAGAGIALAIAKYFKDYDIKPKYNLTFLFTTGEELLFRGAQHYSDSHKDTNFRYWIGFDQLGVKYNNTNLNIYTRWKDIALRWYCYTIVQQSQYHQRTKYYDFNNEVVWNPLSGSEDVVWAYRHLPLWLTRGTIFGGGSPYECSTICFVKDGEKTNPYRHRTGLNHQEGDVMKNMDRTDLNVTFEIALNITKFLAVNPDTWFDGSPTHEPKDSPDDGDTAFDSVDVSFSIDTILPHDQVMVRAILYPEATLDHPAFPFLYRYITEKFYSVTPEGVEDTITISLPKSAPKGNYVLHLHLYNSTGQVIFNTWDDVDRDLPILKSLVENVSKYRPFRSGKIKLFILELIEKGYFFDVVENILDVSGVYLFANESYTPSKFFMKPPNDPPEKPSTPDGPLEVEAGERYFYSTSTYDVDGDKIDYQWKWRANKLFPDKSGWYGEFDSYETYKQGHTWHIPGKVKVKVRARDEHRSPNVFSEWSEPLEVSVPVGCSFQFTSKSTQSQSSQSQTYTEVLVIDQVGTFNGQNYGLDGSCTYDWDFGDSTDATGQSTTHSYNQTGLYNVTLTVNNTITEVNYSIIVNVVNITAGFNATSPGAQPFHNIVFTDNSLGAYDITNWTWNFDDGNISYEQNVSHNYSEYGVYNVTLTVSDNQGNNASSYFIVYIESTSPRIIDAYYQPYYVGVNSNVTISAVLFENQSGIDLVKINVSYPDDSYGDFDMNISENSSGEYKYVFSDTDQIGDYYFSIYVADKANNSYNFSGCSFYVDHLFGYTMVGNQSHNIKDRITGSNFTVPTNGTAENISAYIKTNLSTPPKTKCMIYRDSVLVGTSEEKTLNTGSTPTWVTYNFSGSKPSLVNDTEYVLVCWSNDTCDLYYNISNNVSSGRYLNYSYGDAPDPINWSSYESRIYSIYCSYSTVSDITDVSASPSSAGFGSDVTISADVDDNYCGIENVSVNITYPDNSTGNFTMNNTGNDAYEYVFSDTWLAGEYNYTIWAVDKLGGANSSSGHSFNVSVQAIVSVCTIKDSYGNNETVNLTDPPGESPIVRYELLDDGEVLHIWNRFDSYYFDTSSGIQLTNHFNEYWSHNVLMLGYYNNEQWNLIYRTDELSGFNKDIDTDNETFVNATLWKDLSYGGYDFRLAIRYNLGVDDNELMVIPYIKNIDQDDIPYVLGFGWEMKDIQIDMTTSGDYININGTMYYLNQTLDNVYTELSEPVFYLMENITDSKTKSLYLKWNQSLNFKLQVKSRTGQYNAPVTLFLKIGTLNSGQEKYTEMFWYDADQVTYYFNSYDDSPFGEAWATNPVYMVDGSTSNYASTTSNGDVELCIGNNCSGTDLGTIINVALRVKSYYTGSQRDTILRPVFGGTNDGADHTYQTSAIETWSQWFDITNDPFAPQSWTWSDVDNLDCDVVAEDSPMAPPFTLYCSKVEIRVGYIPYNYEPDVVSPVPVNGASGIGIQPVLNITVSDVDGDDMNISWLSNSSGSWQVFGTNSSVSDGTYHQTFSNATENGQWWYWKLNVSDGEDYTVSSVYKFYTGCQSKIKNTGSTDIKGYLLIQVKFYNTSNSTWIVADDTINETTPRTINSSTQLGLDTVFNGKVNTTYLINNYGTGTYRVYTTFRDPDGNVLVCNDESLMEDSYQFTISSS
jgi:PKD repeat protein